MRYIKVFCYSLAAKTLLRILLNKFNLKKIILNEPKSLIKFAIASANMSATFLIFRRAVRIFKLPIDLEMFLAGCVSSLALGAFEKGELSILKVIVYPRAIE